MSFLSTHQKSLSRIEELENKIDEDAILAMKVESQEEEGRGEEKRRRGEERRGVERRTGKLESG